jgi:hypothetical protein
MTANVDEGNLDGQAVSESPDCPDEVGVFGGLIDFEPIKSGGMCR